MRKPRSLQVQLRGVFATKYSSEVSIMALVLALLRGSAGDWPKRAKMVQNTSTMAFLRFLGVKNDPRVPIRGVRVPILSEHPVCVCIYIYVCGSGWNLLGWNFRLCNNILAYMSSRGWMSDDGKYPRREAI